MLRAAFAGSIAGMIASGVFALLLVCVAISDLRSRRIPNVLVLALLVTGFLFSVVTRGLLAGTGAAAAGFVLGLVLWFPFYLLKTLGAGDVKFFAAAGAWLGPVGTLEAAAAAALIGGALAVLSLLKEHGWTFGSMRVLHGLQQPGTLRGGGGLAPRGKLPYGVPMALGLAAAAWLPNFLW